MHGFWVSTEVFIDDVEGYLWGEGKKIWSSLSDREQWECFDWLCDTMTLEHETGDIDEAIVDWFKSERRNERRVRQCVRRNERANHIHVLKPCPGRRR